MWADIGFIGIVMLLIGLVVFTFGGFIELIFDLITDGESEGGCLFYLFFWGGLGSIGIGGILFAAGLVLGIIEGAF